MALQSAEKDDFLDIEYDFVSIVLTGVSMYKEQSLEIVFRVFGSLMLEFF